MNNYNETVDRRVSYIDALRAQGKSEWEISMALNFWDQANPTDSSDDYTVTVAGPERHDGEKPYTYVVRATDDQEASEIVLAHHKREELVSDVELVEVHLGVPGPECGYYWNDLREQDEMSG